MTILTQTDTEGGAGERRMTELADLAEQMFGSADVTATLDTVANLARRTFGCDAVGVALSGSGAGPTRATAATNPDAVRSEALMQDCHQGPAHQAVARRQPVIVMDLRSDGRWRFWGPQVADLGFRSVLSVALANGDTVGALTLYSRTTSYFHSGDLALTQAFAQHASIAVAIASERDQLLKAVRNRGIVGQAQGILMQRHNVTAPQALTVLGRYTAYLDQDLQQIAERVVRDRCLPDLDPVQPTPLDRRRPSDPTRVEHSRAVHHLEPTGS